MDTDTLPDTDEQVEGQQLTLDAEQADESPDLAAQLAAAQADLQNYQQRVPELERYEQFVHALYSDDPEIRAVALDALGLDDMADPDENETKDAPDERQAPEPDPELAAKVEELQGWRAEREDADRAERAYQQIVEDSAPLFDEQNIPEQAREVILQTALNMPGVETPDGPKPDIAGAVDELTRLAQTISSVPAIRTAILAEYKNSKTGPPAPQGGAPGEQAPNLDNRAERLAFMAARLEDQQ